MRGGKTEVLEAGAWLKERREALGASANLVAKMATLVANRQGDPVTVFQQQLAGIENATEDKGPAKLPSWFRYVRAAFDSGLIGDALGKQADGEPAEKEDEIFYVHDAAGKVIGRLTLLRDTLQ